MQLQSRLFGNTFADNFSWCGELFLYLLFTPLSLSVGMYYDITRFGWSLHLVLEWIPYLIMMFFIFLVFSFIEHTHITLVLAEEKVVKELGIGLFKKDILIEDIERIEYKNRIGRRRILTLKLLNGKQRSLDIKETDEFLELLRMLNPKIELVRN